MKKILTSISLIGLFSLTSYAQTLIPNQPNFTQDNSTYTNILNSIASCGAGNLATVAIDNSQTTGSGLPNGEWIVFDLQKEYKLNQIGLITTYPTLDILINA